jgi:hypothetical protein
MCLTGEGPNVGSDPASLAPSLEPGELMRRTTLAATTLTACALVAIASTIPGSTLGAAPVTPKPSPSATAADTDAPSPIERMDVRVKGRARTAAAVKVSAITYHGGPVMTGTPNVYFIWYGSWASNASGAQILTDFTTALGGSRYYNINTTYTNAAKVAVSNSLTLKASATDVYSQGSTLTDAGVKAVVSKAITSAQLPADANGIYVVLSSADVKESSGFVTKYCGWHTRGTIAATTIRYAFVGDPTTQGLGACAAQTATSPNANPGIDAMVSVLAHEIVETVTDPDLNAWYDSTGYENADKCSWTYGVTYKAANGALANMKLGSRDYLVQQNWKAGTAQGCALAY